MERCHKCKDFLFSHRPTCNCEPFEIDHEGDEETVYGFSFQGVAEKWAREYNENGDHMLMDDNTEEIKITDSDRICKTFIVGAEPDIHYTIDEKE